MFIGHYAVGFASKRFAPEASLGTLLIASMWIDLLWPVLLLLGVESIRIVPGITKVTPLEFVYYPFTHSLLAVAFWAACFSVIYFVFRKMTRPALVLSIAVLSHWFLDALVHIPDLPLSLSGDTRVGLGLWNSVAGTIIVEGTLFIIGVFLYMRSTRPLNNTGKYGPWIFIGLLIFIYGGQFSGATPPNTSIVAYTGLLQWLFVLFAFLVDKNRQAINLTGSRIYK